VLPAGFVPADGAKPEGDGTLYFRRIVRRLGGQEVVFVLVRPHGGTPFYLMENKVSNDLFRAFTEAEKDAAGPQWQKGGLAGGKNVVPLNGQHPVFRVTRAEAERCAKWLGGRLPDPAELEQAMAGPTGRPAIGRWNLGPRPVNDPENEDVSRAGVRDLSGNGREWTRGVLRAGGEEVAILGGRSYAAPGPAAEPRSEAKVTQYPDHRSPFTTFRVLIELSTP
jgi:formylglycine-generating enzyme required for sulfatase activity